MTYSRLIIAPAENRHEIEVVRLFFREYAASLDFDLRFQGFEEELSLLPCEYVSPSGCLLLAWDDKEAAGCVALRRFSGSTCEMKRLFVRPKFRGCGYGRRLAEEAIRHAREIGYRRMVLDTIGSMQAAIGLYVSLGFTEILPYRYNPLPRARFFGLDLECKKN
ncbi:MAG: GNAT family N-acetyltransferase [Candidatus Aminicenantales bacterium]